MIIGMIEDFIVNAIVGGVLVALVAGPLGCFLVWRRMAYFGDTISHSALMGVALGLALGTSQTWIIVATAMVISMFLLLLERGGKFSSDTLLGILAHASLAAGLILISQNNSRQNMMSYLTGDILAITSQDIISLSIMALCLLGGISYIWRSLLTITVHEDLARVEGVNVLRTKIIYMLLIAIMVAFAMKVVGALLITAMMIIPAAAARTIATSPFNMAITSSLLGVISVFSGIFASSEWDIPAGPAIIIAATCLFLIGRFLAPKTL
jgi:zinc transport system permease protein